MATRSSRAPIQVDAIHPDAWNKTKLNRILTQSRGRKILVVGDVGIDRYTLGSVERISPEAPVPIVAVEEEKLKLGLAANVADNIHVLGGIPILVGVVGKDRCADDFRSLLTASGLQANQLVVDPTRRTVLKERVVSERQQLLRIDYESLHNLSPRVEAQILRKVKAWLPKVDGVIVEDYAKGVLTESLMSQIFKAAKRAGKKLALDPNLKTPVQHYRGATVLTPNTHEAEVLSGVRIVNQESLVQAGFSILRLTDAQHVVITRGKEGMAIFTAGCSVVRLIPTYAKEVYDVSGAGDTVISVLMMSLLSGALIEEAAVLGNLAAGIEVGKRGTATVSPEEIRKSLELFEGM